METPQLGKPSEIWREGFDSSLSGVAISRRVTETLILLLHISDRDARVM